ncbi:MAG: CBS domain-containing protein [Candidatus Woesearchaeota archaeon]
MEAKDIIQKEFVKINKDDNISQFANSLKRDKHKTGLVFDGDDFLGIISFRHLIHARVQPHATKIGNHVAHVPHLRENTDILDVAYFMFHSNARALPVFDNDKVVGIVEATDVVAQTKNYSEIKNKKVGDLSLKSSPIVNEKDRLGKLLQIFQDEDVDRVPIVDDKKNLSGIVAFTDIIEKYYLQTVKGDHGSSSKAKMGGISYVGELPDLDALSVSNFMNKIDLVTATKNDTLGNVVQLMSSNNVSSVIIVEGKTPVSIITKRDILGEMLKLKEQIKFLIKYIGLNDLLIEENTRAMVAKMAEHHAAKLEHFVPNIQEMDIHFKQHKEDGKEGKRHRFSVHIRLVAPTRIFTSTKSTGWNIFRVLHDSFIDLEHQIQKAFHTDAKLSEKRKGSRARKKGYR